MRPRQWWSVCRRFALPALASAMTELHRAANLAPFAEASAPGKAGAPTPGALRVMSFNVRYGDADDGNDAWKFRRDLVARTIRRFDPDLLGVQEALNLQCDD